MDIRFKMGKNKGLTPAEVYARAASPKEAIDILQRERAYLEQNLSNPKYQKANEELINEIDRVLKNVQPGSGTGQQQAPKTTSAKQPGLAYSVRFDGGTYKGLTPAEVILSANDQDRENVLEDLRYQYKLLKISNDKADQDLAAAIKEAGVLYNNGKLTPQPEQTKQSPQTESTPSDDSESSEKGPMLTMKDHLKNGSIMVNYDSRFLCNVAPAFGIHKVRWSIVELKTNGKNHWDFYMGIDDFHRFCMELDSGAAWKKFQADKEASIPEAYQFVTGTNGSKRLNIGGGRKGVRININIQDEGYANTVVPFSAMKDMSFYFKLVSGLIPSSRYFGQLADAFWEGEAARNEYHTQN